MTLTAPSRSSAGSWVDDRLFRATVHPGARVTLTGELDIGALDALRAALDQALLEPDETIHINAVQLSFIDSTAITELLRYHLAAAVQHRKLYLEHVSRPVATVLDILDLGHILMNEADLTQRRAKGQ